MQRDVVVVYTAENMPQAEMLRQELESVGIQAMVEPTASPLDGLSVIDQGTPVLVHAEHAPRAREIVQQFFDAPPTTD